MSLLISDAFAEAATTAQATQPDGTFSMVMITVIFVLFYFMLIRPQNKRAKDHRNLVAKIQKGDEIVTSGGILGKVITVDEQFVKVSICEGMEVTVQRNAISTLLPKGTMKAL